MAKRNILIIRTNRQRQQAIDAIAKLPEGWSVEFRPPNRTLEQNARLWSMLTDLSKQINWAGVRLTPEDWKTLMTAGLKRELRMVPNVAGDGFVQLGEPTSTMSVRQLNELMDFISAFGAEHGVQFRVETEARPGDIPHVR